MAFCLLQSIFQDAYRNHIDQDNKEARLQKYRVSSPKKRVAWEKEEKITILIAVNTIGKQWKKILNRYPQVFTKNGRTNSSLQDAYKQMVKQGLAVQDWSEDEDCYTHEAMEEFDLEEKQRDLHLLPFA